MNKIPAIYPKAIASTKLDTELLFLAEELVNARDLPIPLRTAGSFQNHGFYLDSSLDWFLVTDEMGAIVLVPTRKTKAEDEPF